MALTANQKKAWELIVQAEEDSGPGLKTDALEADTTIRNAYLRSVIQKYRDLKAAEKAGLPARNTQLTNEIAVLDGMLALYQ